jgi:hypothetical protein
VLLERDGEKPVPTTNVEDAVLTSIPYQRSYKASAGFKEGSNDRVVRWPSLELVL